MFITAAASSFLNMLCQADNRKQYKEEDNDHLDDQTAADVAWSKHKLLNESIIVALFQGQFKSTVQCLTCHRKSRTFETFMYLSLPLASTSKCSLQVSWTLTCTFFSVLSQIWPQTLTDAGFVAVTERFCVLVGLSETFLQGREADRQQQGVL